MLRSAPYLVTQTIESGPPLGAFLRVAGGLGLILALTSFYTSGAVTVPLAVFVITVMFAGYGLVHSYGHDRLGLCNMVTLGRAAMAAFIGGAVLVPGLSVWVIFGVATLAFALDGVDGWLARRAGLASDFGARFDMEVDAGLAAMISLWLLARGIVGPEVLILGFMRYAFFGASFVWTVLRTPLPQAFRRKAICVVQIGTLILLTFPLTPQGMVLPLGAFAALLLSWSFLIDILWLARRAA